MLQQSATNAKFAVRFLHCQLADPANIGLFEAKAGANDLVILDRKKPQIRIECIRMDHELFPILKGLVFPLAPIERFLN